MALQSTQAADVVISLLNKPGPVADAIRRAQGEGRAPTREELQGAFDQDSAALQSLAGAVQQANAR